MTPIRTITNNVRQKRLFLILKKLRHNLSISMRNCSSFFVHLFYLHLKKNRDRHRISYHHQVIDTSNFHNYVMYFVHYSLKTYKIKEKVNLVRIIGLPWPV